MTKKLIGYKILTKNGRKSAIQEWGVCQYNINKKTVPLKGHGPLCVFATLKKAKYFLNLWISSSYFSSFIIVKCYYQPSVKTKVWTMFSKRDLQDLPHDTILADSVTCLK